MSRYDAGLKKGKKDCKKGRRSEYQILCMEKRQKCELTQYQNGYIDGYNCQMNNHK